MKGNLMGMLNLFGQRDCPASRSSLGLEERMLRAERSIGRLEIRAKTMEEQIAALSKRLPPPLGSK